MLEFPRGQLRNYDMFVDLQHSPKASLQCFHGDIVVSLGEAGGVATMLEAVSQAFGGALASQHYRSLLSPAPARRVESGSRHQRAHASLLHATATNSYQLLHWYAPCGPNLDAPCNMASAGL
eukprot:3288003-Amphidinium_carterae.2